MGRGGIAWVKNMWRGRQLDMDLDDELRAYLAQLTDEYRARGYEPEEALRAARIEAGAIESIKDQVRDARSGASIERCGRTFGLASACFVGRRPSWALRSCRSRLGSVPTARCSVC